jgi:hypothetical protein
VVTAPTQTANRKALIEMDEDAYQALRTTAKQHERSLSSRVRQRIRREGRALDVGRAEGVTDTPRS